MKQDLTSYIYQDYSLNHYTIPELAKKYHYSEHTIWRRLDTYKFNKPYRTNYTLSVNLVFDAFYLKRGYGWLVFRADGKTIHYNKITYESIDTIAANLSHLDRLGYEYKSITIDGRKGVLAYLKVHYPNVPIQYCMFHQKQTIRQCLTNNPKTPCGQELKDIANHLKDYDTDSLLVRLNELKQQYRDFLKERNEEGRYMHRRVRRAIRSLYTNAPYLYTYKRYPELEIPTTTNSCDGYFSHIKSKLRVHSGLTAKHRDKLIEFMLNINFFGN